jgi:hypothetical protein
MFGRDGKICNGPAPGCDRSQVPVPNYKKGTRIGCLEMFGRDGKI